MARNIFEVNATQVVTSESHPEGVRSVISGFPKTYDTKDYEDSEELALVVAQAEYSDRVKQLSLAHNRAMWTVTLEQADGRQIARKSYGGFPVLEPEPEEEPTEPGDGE